MRSRGKGRQMVWDSARIPNSSRLHAVALDFTGHGLSSHLPKGCAYSVNHYPFDVTRAARFLGWEQFSLVGHSLGGMVSQYYGSLFPERVRKMVVLDGFGYFYTPPSQVAKRLRNNMVQLLRLEQKSPSEQPSYTEEEVIALHAKDSSYGYLPADTRTLMKRGCRSVGGGRFVFTRDHRLRATFWNSIERTATLKFLQGYKNDMLVINALPGLGACSITHNKMEKQYQCQCRSFRVLEFEGNHHMHMNQAGLVAEHVLPFLLEGP